jgi:sugar phosphate isomerase/epimerase
MISFKKWATTLGLLIFVATISLAQKAPEKKLGWTLSAHTYTFNRFTLSEAMDKALEAGVRSIEVFPGQKLGGHFEGSFDYKMPKEKQKELKKVLKKKKIKIAAIGVISLNNEEDWKELFAFAKNMNISIINTEPHPRFMPLLGQLATTYKIRVAIHNHPKPSRYWDPQVVLHAIEASNSSYVGACADIGHWIRSGLNSIECLQQLEGHLFSLHFKDLKENSPQTHDVHWGTGVGNIEGVISELKRQNFKGNISGEYEYRWENNVGDLKQSIQNFRNILSAQK